MKLAVPSGERVVIVVPAETPSTVSIVVEHERGAILARIVIENGIARILAQHPMPPKFNRKGNRVDAFFNSLAIAFANSDRETIKKLGNEHGVRYHFRITGQDGSEWTVDLMEDSATVVRGCVGVPNCTIDVSHAGFCSMLDDPNMGLQLYFMGTMHLGGDPLLGMKLQPMFDLAAKYADY